MRLTDFFKTDRPPADAEKAVSQTQADSAKAAQISRQIRALVPGQTIQGEVVAKNGSEVQIKVLEDFLMSARLEQSVNIEVGKNMTFQVRNNGKALVLSPLFANMATDANTLKALDMASLPVNDTTVEMTRQMMGAGLPIDKNSLQQVFREVMAFPDAEILDIIDLHRLSLPVTENNLEQLEAYKNLTHQLVNGMNDVLEALPDVMQNMAQSGNVEGAAGLYREILSMAAEMPAEALLETFAGEDTLQQEGILPENILNTNDSENVGSSNTVLQNVVAEDIATGNTAQGEITPGNVTPEDIVTTDSAAQEAVLDAPSKEIFSQIQNLAKELSGLTGQEIPENADVSKLLDFAGQALQKGIAEHDTKLLRELIGNKDLQNIVNNNLQKLWTIKPEDVANPNRVEELYQRLDKQIRGVTRILESAGQTSTEAYKASANLSGNLDFMQQVNQVCTYIQLPLRFQQHNAHGELYVYTNKKNLASKDGAVSALLHLDMDHLGPVDVYVSMQNQKVNTQFYVQDDDMLDFLEEHMDLLTERLKKRGYDCSCKMQIRNSGDEDDAFRTNGVIQNLLARAGNIKLSQYAFDVRA
ncbi:MAG: flagellar hook-length control protein FliK [Bacteroidales bacterium]|nr:flagellar hook-length control protein FliK [Lachnoclostridium sp.]MCM1385406.1 flagellar hook-length control protein FliK [Lachnoclostridium sp.]MCM1464112.1 flagellar hook-length control protein FliK [Bacteroidales bacterium]